MRAVVYRRTGPSSVLEVVERDVPEPGIGEVRVRLQHLRRDPRVSLTVLDEASWYTHVSLLGRVTEMRDDEGLVDIDRCSTHYGGQPYPDRESPRVSAWVTIERWHGWGAAKD